MDFVVIFLIPFEYLKSFMIVLKLMQSISPSLSFLSFFKSTGIFREH